MTDEQRTQAERLAVALRRALAAPDSPEARQGRLGIVAKMLLSYPVAGASEATGRARGEAYMAALDDVPPWAIDAAVRRWHRGECGDAHNYGWAPSPATLRSISREMLVPYREAAERVDLVLGAGTIDQAMERKPKGPIPQSIRDLLERMKGRAMDANEVAE